MPILEISDVTQVPIFCPMMMGIAIPKVMLPVMERDCRMPTDAAELWMIPVTMAPRRIPAKGFWNMTKISLKTGMSASGLTESLMKVIPVIRMEKPTRIEPASFFFPSLEERISTMPTNAMIGAKDSGFRRRGNREGAEHCKRE